MIFMTKQATLITKKRRGPAPTGVGQLIGVRLQPDLIALLDRFIEDRETGLTRPEAIRLILAERLKSPE